MKKIFCGLLLSLCFLLSCHSENTPRDTKQWRITTKTILGRLTIQLPNEYDTCFEWVHYTDYTRGAEYKIRMQPKTFPVNMESGFLWNDLRDTVHQLTIAYMKYPDADTSYVYTPEQNFKSQLIGEGKIFGETYNMIDTLRSADNKILLVCNYEDNRKNNKPNVRVQTLNAQTFHKGQWIEFEFVSKMYYGSSDSDFIAKSLKAIKTIRFLTDKGQSPH